MAQQADKNTETLEPEGKKAGKLKLLLLLLLVLLILGGGAWVAWKFFLATPSPPLPEVQETEEVLENKFIPEQLVTLEPFVVNLSDPMGRRYLKLTLDVEMSDMEAVTDLETSMPLVKDTLLLLLSSKSFADISTIDQKLELKNNIVDRLNLVIGPGKVRNVYFTEFVIQ